MLLQNDEVKLIFHTFIINLIINLIKVIYHEYERREYISPSALEAANNYFGYGHRNSSGNRIAIHYRTNKQLRFASIEIFDGRLY